MLPGCVVVAPISSQMLIKKKKMLSYDLFTLQVDLITVVTDNVIMLHMLACSIAFVSTANMIVSVDIVSCSTCFCETILFRVELIWIQLLLRRCVCVCVSCLCFTATNGLENQFGAGRCDPVIYARLCSRWSRRCISNPQPRESKTLLSLLQFLHRVATDRTAHCLSETSMIRLLSVIVCN